MLEGMLQPIIQPNPEEQTGESPRSAADSPHRVIVHNDEVTPYDYVLQTLELLFMLSEELADHVAWIAHTKGYAIVVVRPRSEAETLVKIAHAQAKRDGFPLTFSLESD